MVARGATVAAGEAAVELTDVDVAFRLADGGVFRAVHNASLTVADGEFVAIVGPTGCGKSTLLNIAAGLLAPAAGSAAIFGAPLNGLNRQVWLPVSGPTPCFPGRRRSKTLPSVWKSMACRRPRRERARRSGS